MGRDRDLQSLAPVLREIADAAETGNRSKLNGIQKRLEGRYKQIRNSSEPLPNPGPNVNARGHVLQTISRVLDTVNDLDIHGEGSKRINDRVKTKSRILKTKRSSNR
jgi:hypothetical protein